MNSSSAIGRWTLDVGRWAFAALLVIVACLVAIAVMITHAIDTRPVESDQPPRPNIGGNAIANFGLAPLNPQWMILTHKDGTPVTDALPAPDQAVITSEFEPVVTTREVMDNGPERRTWTITFNP